MVVQQGTSLIVRSRAALQLTQRELATKLGWSQRTIVRWEGGRSDFNAIDALKLAPHIYPIDRELAAELVAHGGHTLVSAGLEAEPTPAAPTPPAPQPAPQPPVAVVAAPPPLAPEVLLALVESVVCAAADAADTTPKAVRASVHLVLRHAHAIRLDLDAAMKAGLLSDS
jgi:DNA-binding XRE family transcriptional regulator